MKMPLLLLLACTVSITRSQTVEDSLLIDGSYRTFRIHTPPGFSAAEHLPLVLNLHGLTSTGAQQEAYSEMNEVADAERFIVVYPDGVNNSWNLGLGAVDEYGFFTGLIDRMVLTHNINTDRVYACGMSQGGFMSFVLACSMYDRIAAIATVAGSMAPGLDLVCAPPRAVPVLMIHGTADGIVPFTGGIQNLAVPDAVGFWVQHNNCDAVPVISSIPDIVPLDLCSAERQDHYNGDASSEVALIRVDGGGHTWPGSAIPIGVTNQDFEASQAIWDFFDRFDIGGGLSAPDAIDLSGNFVISSTLFNERVEIYQSTNATAEVQVTDATGRIVASAMVPSGQRVWFETHQWAPGPYLWVLRTSELRFVQRTLCAR
ncbi:MAG: hypothetical protein IPG10_17905 [Flavobacteriales bacterium]|nr:hypothetical protein [Flavobacteriales bacterium]